MGKIADILGVTKSTLRIGDCCQDPAQSFFCWKQVVNHFPQECILTGFQTSDACKAPSPVPIYVRMFSFYLASFIILETIIINFCSDILLKQSLVDQI